MQSWIFARFFDSCSKGDSDPYFGLGFNLTYSAVEF